MRLRTLLLLLLCFAVVLLSCGSDSSSDQRSRFSGVLMWKGDPSTKGLYANETTLTPQNVNPTQFGKRVAYNVDGLIFAQPLYVPNLDMGSQGVHNVVIVATEHDSVYAFDADTQGSAPLWHRNYLDPANGITTPPDNFGGRTALGGEIGITGTPVIDPATGAMYFVTTIQRNGQTEQWLRAVDIRTGQDFGPGSVKIEASVPGDGVGSSNGQIAFDPSIHNQRAGLILVNGAVVIGWGSFSDFGAYHGWLMAYDAATLRQVAVFNPTTQFQAEDTASGPADHGGGGSFWHGGAAPAIDSAGIIYVVAADGSFNADRGGQNYGNTVLKLRLENGRFQIVDWFAPSNQACVNPADLEIGSGGIALLPSEAGSGRSLGATVNKEGRLYLLDLNNLGKLNPSDAQIPQQFLVGDKACFPGMGDSRAEGTDWNRLYGNPAYWNGNLYLAPANGTVRQYKFQNGVLNTTPFAQSATITWLRGGNPVVSSNGNQNGILWTYIKNADVAELRAYDANDISRELWNTRMNPSRDGMGVGVGFGTPVVANGKVITTFENWVVIYGLL